MKIIDRYAIREFTLPFFCCLFIFISLYIIIDLFSRLDDILKQQVAVMILFRYYTAFLPIIFVRTAPVAALLSTLYVLGNLTKYNEVLALKASGINIWRIALPFLFLGLLISAVTLIINDRIIPQANLTSTTVKEEHLDKGNGLKKEQIIENIAIYGTRNRLIHVRKFYPQDNLLQEVTILEQNENAQVTAKIQAKQAKWSDNRWVFLDCVVYNFNQFGQEIDQPNFYKKMFFDIEEKPKDFLNREASAEFMSYQKLKKYVTRLQGSSAKIVQKLQVELNYKIAFPFVSLVIMFLGIPFALSAQGTGKIASVGLCLVIALFYYTVEALSLALGQRGTLPPLLSAWFANILFATVGVLLMHRAPK